MNQADTINEARKYLREVVSMGLVPAHPLTTNALVRDFPGLGETIDERRHYARQLVEEVRE